MNTSASYSFTVRIKAVNETGMIARITASISSSGGDIGAIDIVSSGDGFVTRDYLVSAGNSEHSLKIIEAIKKVKGAEVLTVSDRTFLIHLGGKIEVTLKRALKTRDDLSMAYTPGVARVCMEIAKDKSKAYKLTIKNNTIAIVTDGTAVLGLGDIGPEAAMPVMEGKAMLFKKFGGVNAFPICLDTKDTEEIIETVKRIAPGFGGINLEDISSPRCFEIEKRLTEELDIPVFHDDQHGTAVVVLAGLINSLKVVGKKIEDVKIVVNGAGAAGIACIDLLHNEGARNIVAVDSCGVLCSGRENLNSAKEELISYTNPDHISGSLADAMKDADIFLGLSVPDVLTVDMVKSMAKDAIVFALANPVPEINPELAEPHARIVATGRSDYKNQINNVLCFPGLFKGLLDCNAREINDDMMVAAARAIASVVKSDELSEDYIIPSVFNSTVGKVVSKAVMEACIKTGVARRVPSSEKES